MVRKTAVLLFALLSLPLFAGPIRLAVLPVTGESLSADEALILQSYLETALFQTGAYTIVDQDRQDIVLANLTKSASGLYDEETMLEIGKLLSVEQLCFGTVTRAQSTYHMTLKFIDAETSAVTVQKQTSAESFGDLYDGIDVMVLSMHDFENKDNSRFSLERKDIFTVGGGVALGRSFMGGLVGRWNHRLDSRWEVGPGAVVLIGDGFGAFVNGYAGYFLSDNIVLSAGAGLGYHDRYYDVNAGTTLQVVEADVCLGIEYSRWGFSLILPISLSFVGLVGTYSL